MINNNHHHKLPPVTRHFALVGFLQSLQLRITAIKNEIARLEADAQSLTADYATTSEQLGDLVLKLALDLKRSSGKSLSQCTTAVLNDAKETIMHAAVDHPEHLLETFVDLSNCTTSEEAQRTLANHILFSTNDP